MIIDLRRNVPNYKPIMVKGEAVEQEDKYRYLGLVIGNNRVWHENTDEIIKKVHSRLFCLRKLRSFRVREDILQVFFLSTISSVLTHGCVCWGGNASKQDGNRLEKIIRKAGGVIDRQRETFDSVYHGRLLKILSDDTHPMRPEFDSRLIDRSGRLRVRTLHKSNTPHLKQSSIPKAAQT